MWGKCVNSKSEWNNACLFETSRQLCMKKTTMCFYILLEKQRQSAGIRGAEKCDRKWFWVSFSLFTCVHPSHTSWFLPSRNISWLYKHHQKSLRADWEEVPPLTWSPVRWQTARFCSSKEGAERTYFSQLPLLASGPESRANLTLPMSSTTC